jgi:leader peptidase (prepilin peptidase) / N-methyltransferase
MIRILGSIFAGLLGLAFGSFLNVCLSRWPAGESVVSPRSHCRNCDHVLAWWENVPLVSWLALRGRCRKCHTAISWRYPLVELAVATLWAVSLWQALRGWQGLDAFLYPGWAASNVFNLLFFIGGKMVLCWLLVALAVLDLENLWLPDWLTLTGAAVGLLVNLLHFGVQWILASTTPELMRNGRMQSQRHEIDTLTTKWLLGILAAAALILVIRWVYKLIRKREGMGLGDAKLMALLAAWLGLPAALLAFGLGAILGSITALALLAVPAARRGSESWAATRLPFGTFLCIGGLISSLWGQTIINDYLRWAGF